MTARAALRAALALGLALPAASAAARSGRGAAVTPVQKVVQLLEGMAAKGKLFKKQEEVQFAAYKQFCDDTAAEKQRAIEDAGEQIVSLKASLLKSETDVKRLTKDIAAHDSDAAAWTRDIENATEVRSKENADYTKLHKDYSESLDALQRAVDVLKKQDYKRAQASLAQLAAGRSGSGLAAEQVKRAIEALSEQQPQGAPEAYGYEFQSSNVVTMLQKLSEKFQTERTALEKEEVAAKQAFELLVQDLKAQVEQAKRASADKTASRSKKAQAAATAKGDLQDTIATRDADQTYLTDLVATCEQKANDFVARQDLRSQELKAIGQAIEIISGSAVSGNAEKYLPSLLDMDGTALASLRSEMQGREQAAAARFLQGRAEQLQSRVLGAAASRLVVGSDPFMKVKKMIKDLIIRLQEEANDEATHKGWCDTELSTNSRTRKEKTEAVETLHAQADQLEASLAKLSQELVDLTKAVAELEVAISEATKLRSEEKAKNEKTVADAKEAQTAVAQALVVLREFYAKAGEATALLLQGDPQAPPIFDSPYQGMQAASGGVVGMLEVIESDFARLEASTEAAEVSAQKEYDTFMTDSKVDKARKEQDIKFKSAKKQDQTDALAATKGDLEGTQKELDVALAYFDRLKPSCLDASMSYEDRVKRRGQEIESLQTALRILNGEDTA